MYKHVHDSEGQSGFRGEGGVEQVGVLNSH